MRVQPTGTAPGNRPDRARRQGDSPRPGVGRAPRGLTRPTAGEGIGPAVDEFLRRRREARIDAELEAGYRAAPAGADEATWADVAVDGLQAADLDW